MPLLAVQALFALPKLGKTSSPRPELAAQLERLTQLVGPGLERLSNLYVHPMLALKAAEIRKYIEERGPTAYAETTQLTEKIVHLLGVEGATSLIHEVVRLVDEAIQAYATKLPTKVLGDFREAFHLEVENELYLLQLLQPARSLDLLGVLAAHGVQVDELVTTAAKLNLAVLGFLEGLEMEKPGLELLLAELSTLALEYAEERDAQITTLDIILDERKRRELDAAVAELQQSQPAKG